MDMKAALKIMSEQPSGHFTWKDQIITLYNVLSSDDVGNDVTVEELLRRVDEMDAVVRDVFYSVKVDFNSTPNVERVPPVTLHYKVALSIMFFMIYLLSVSSGGDEETVNQLLSLLKHIVEALTST